MLSGKYQDGARPEGARFSRYLAMEGQRQAAMALRFVNDRTLAATARYLTIAGEAGLHPVTMATAWSKQPDFVASTIVGVSAARSEERRVGTEVVSTGQSRLSRYP